MNAYYMLRDIRDNVVENVAKHWGDNDILRKMNMSHRTRNMELHEATGDWLLKSATLTPSSSEITLPSDCSKPVYMEHATGLWEIPMDQTVRERGLTRIYGSQLSDNYVTAYPIKDKLVINQESFTDNVVLWYLQRIPNLICGTADTGSTGTSLVIAQTDEPSLVDDYYNDLNIEINLQSGGSSTRTTVSDYVASTRTISVTAGTITTSTIYGTVTDLPDEAIDVIILEATIKCLAKPGARLDAKYFEFYQTLYKEAKKAWLNWCSTRRAGAGRIRITEGDG